MRTLIRFALPVLLVAAAVVATLMPRRAQAELADLGAAPAFAFRTLDGGELTAPSLKGKVVVVDFWATWCPPCVEEIPGYVELQKKHGADGLVIIGVSFDRRGAEHVRQFAARMGINYALAMGGDEVADQFGGFDALPTTFLIDREGRIRHRKVGAMAHEDYEKILLPLLR
jgi:thiol-disulfide isomerase/thioredoxin